MRLDVRQRVHQIVAKPVDALGKFAGELLVGGGEREFRARMDQIRHGLGLREINASVQKGAAREFAGLGQPRAVFEQRVEHQLRGQNTAVTGNLHRVLARERARRAQHGEQHFVNHLSAAHDFAVLDRVRRRDGRFQGIFAGGQKTFVGDRQRLRAGNADDGQPAFTERRGDGGDGVVEHG